LIAGDIFLPKSIPIGAAHSPNRAIAGPSLLKATMHFGFSAASEEQCYELLLAGAEVLESELGRWCVFASGDCRNADVMGTREKGNSPAKFHCG